MVVQFGSIELDRTWEDDLTTFDKLKKDTDIDLRVRAFVTAATETKRVLRVYSLEISESP